MRKSIQWTLGLGFSCVACGAAPTSETGTAADTYGETIPITATAKETLPAIPSVVAQETVLSEIVLSDQIYTFLDEFSAGEESTLLLKTTGSIAQGNILDTLRRTEGDLTMLEIFEALAPDRVPPDELVAAQAEEARALGRSDSEDRLVEKSQPPPGVSPCDPSLFIFSPLTWTNTDNGTAAFDAFQCVSNLAVHDDSGRGAPTSSSCTYATTNRTMVGVCLAGSGPSIVTQAGFGSASTWQLTSSTTVPRGQYLRYDQAPSSTPRRLAVLGITGGSGATYGLRAGEGH
jgi:hypothetical protein